MSRNIWTWILAGALTASVALNVTHWMSTPPEAAPAFSMDALDLTPAQVTSLMSCCEDCGWGDDDLQARVEAHETELARMLSQHEVDEDAVASKTEELIKLRREMLERCVRTIVSVRGVLSEEQCEVLGSCCCGK